MAKYKTDVRKLPDEGGGANHEAIERMKLTGQLKQFSSREELLEAREKRKQRGVKETPAYLLPEDHFRKRKRHTITMSPEARAIARKIGNGNVSGGIERALLHWFDCPRTDLRRGKK